MRTKMKKRHIHFWVIFLFLIALNINAQEADSTALKVIDSTGLIPKLSDQNISETPINIAAIDLPKREQLKDLEEAYTYDSLWIAELYKNNSDFNDMLAEVNNLSEPVEPILDLPTDTLKARLKRLNEKTPFNIAYNPSLESVIQSFLKRRRSLIENMLTKSQFYFPIF